MKLILIALAISTTISTSVFAKEDKIEIKSGTNGTTYCTPMEDPRCKSHRAVEMQRLNERRDYERRTEDYERKDRERELERRYDYRR